MNSDRKSLFCWLCCSPKQTPKERNFVPILIQHQEARESCGSGLIKLLTRYQAVTILRLNFSTLILSLWNNVTVARISLEPCNLGLEQIEKNQLNSSSVFPTHSSSVTKQIPWYLILLPLLCFWYIDSNVFSSFCCHFRSMKWSANNLVLIMSLYARCILVGKSENCASGMSWNVMGS